MISFIAMLSARRSSASAKSPAALPPPPEHDTTTPETTAAIATAIDLTVFFIFIYFCYRLKATACRMQKAPPPLNMTNETQKSYTPGQTVVGTKLIRKTYMERLITSVKPYPPTPVPLFSSAHLLSHRSKGPCGVRPWYPYGRCSVRRGISLPTGGLCPQACL